MRRLNKEVKLHGLDTVTMMELRARPGEVLDSVMLGKTFIITRGTRHNKTPVAVLSRLPGEQLSIKVNGDGTIEYEL